MSFPDLKKNFGFHQPETDFWYMSSRTLRRTSDVFFHERMWARVHTGECEYSAPFACYGGAQRAPWEAEAIMVSTEMNAADREHPFYTGSDPCGVQHLSPGRTRESVLLTPTRSPTRTSAITWILVRLCAFNSSKLVVENKIIYAVARAMNQLLELSKGGTCSLQRIRKP